MFSWAVLSNLESQDNFLLDKIRNMQLPESVCVKQIVIHIVHWHGLILFTMFCQYVECHIWNLKKNVSFLKASLLTLRGRFARRPLLAIVWLLSFFIICGQIFSLFSFITFEPRPNPAYSPKCNKTQTFMRHFFSKAGHLTLTQFLSPEKRSGSLTLSPAFHLHLKWLQTGLSAKWMEEASTVSEL